ncbi:MAG: response regulator [bacterium]|nr:response regulator [bacterium]
MNILLVEDDPIHIKLVERALKKSGFNNQLIVARDGEEVFNYLFNQNMDQRSELMSEEFVYPHLILMDINLPKINGLEILRRIKQSPQLQHIPVVILTTSSNRADLEKCYEYHANSYVIKPLDYEEFNQKIRSIEHYWLMVNEILYR